MISEGRIVSAAREEEGGHESQGLLADNSSYSDDFKVTGLSDGGNGQCNETNFPENVEGAMHMKGFETRVCSFNPIYSMLLCK